MENKDVKYNGISVKEIVNAIKKITDGTYIVPNYTTTLLGWREIYDRNGNLVSVDPNIKSGTVNIEGTEYVVYRKGWRVVILKPQYTEEFKGRCYIPSDKEMYMADFSIEPLYVREYRESKEVNNA